MNPAVSILLPVRNAGSTLDACLVSIASQTMQDFELLLVDDHSSDSSFDIAASHARRDPRFRLLRNPGDGLVAALNYGLSQASADLIARMDADDLMLPQRLAMQLAHMKLHPDTVVLGTQVEKFPEISAGFREYIRWQNQCLTADDIDSEIYIESPFAHPSVMLRRHRIIEAGAYRDGDFPEDYELWLRLHALGCRMEKLPEVLMRWRDSPNRLSRLDQRYRRNAFDKLRAKYLAADRRLRTRQQEFAIWGAGRRTRQRCAHLLKQGFSPCAWIDIDPRKIGNRLNGVPVVEPGWLVKNRVFVLVYVSNHGARDDIAEWLHRQGYSRAKDYLIVG